MSDTQSMSLRVLLAEDSAVNQKLAAALLERQGHAVTVATTGRQAVELLQQQAFDLVLMDVQMPEMDGLEATRRIRQAEAGSGRHVPIVAMTGNELAGDRDRCLEAGMDDYIAKPLTANQLAHKIAQLGTLAQPVAPPAALRIDWPAALAGLGGKRALMRELVVLFSDEAPRLLNDARAAIAANNPDALRMAAHTLKGSARYFGPNQVADLAQQVESLASQQQLAAASAQVELLAAAMAEMLPRLQEFDAAEPNRPK